MKYMLLIYLDERAWSQQTEGQRQEIYSEYRQLIQELTSSGHYVAGSQLQPTTTATSVQMRNGKELVTDGPFAETREQLGGYFLVETKGLDEAIRIAGRVPSARVGTVEVRPIA
jgi:hypothetical protein